MKMSEKARGVGGNCGGTPPRTRSPSASPRDCASMLASRLVDSQATSNRKRSELASKQQSSRSVTTAQLPYCCPARHRQHSPPMTASRFGQSLTCTMSTIYPRIYYRQLRLLKMRFRLLYHSHGSLNLKPHVWLFKKSPSGSSLS